MELKDRILQRLDEAVEKVVETFKHGSASVVLKTRDTKTWLLTSLKSEDRGKGDAKKVMELAIAHADKNKKDLILHAVPDDDTDADRLVKFYSSFGFEKSGGFNAMTRKHQGK